MKKRLANIITGSRILCSIWMLFPPVFSRQFYILYLLCGFTDMIDGTVARKTNSVTAFGSRLDSVADFVFAGAECPRLALGLHFPHHTCKNHKSHIGVSAEPAIDR